GNPFDDRFGSALRLGADFAARNTLQLRRENPSQNLGSAEINAHEVFPLPSSFGHKDSRLITAACYTIDPCPRSTGFTERPLNDSHPPGIRTPKPPVAKA